MELIQLSFDNLTVLFAIGAIYSASVAVVVSTIVKSLGWSRPYSRKQEQILQWTPALASSVIGALFAPFVYSLVVGPVSGWEWHAAGIPVGFMSGLMSKPAYYLLKSRLAPAFIDSTEGRIKG